MGARGPDSQVSNTSITWQRSGDAVRCAGDVLYCVIRVREVWIGSANKRSGGLTSVNEKLSVHMCEM